MEKDEPEVVHLEWERVEDPTRDPPPVLVVTEPEPEPHIIPRWNDPNPFREDAPRPSSLAEFITLLLFLFMAAGLATCVGALW